MPEIRLRAATPADDAFFCEMEFSTTWQSLDEEDRRRLTPDQVRESLGLTHELLLNQAGHQVVIAEEDGRRVGLLWMGPNRNLVTGQAEAWVYNVSVVAECQGRGIGRLLMEHAERLAREGGYEVLGLMVATHNRRAHALYESLAFRATNLLMRKRLD